MGVPDRLSAILDTQRMSINELTSRECAQIVIAVAQKLKQNFGNLTQVQPLSEIMEGEASGASAGVDGDLAAIALRCPGKWDRQMRCLTLVVLDRTEFTGSGYCRYLLLTYTGQLLIWTCRYMILNAHHTSYREGMEFCLASPEILESILTPERTNALLDSLSDKLADSVKRAENRLKHVNELSRYLVGVNRRLDVKLRLT